MHWKQSFQKYICSNDLSLKTLSLFIIFLEAVAI